MNRLLTTGALALTAAGLLASSAQAAGPNTCIYNPSSKNVSVKLQLRQLHVDRPRRQQVRHVRRVRQDGLHQHDRRHRDRQQHGRDLHERLDLGPNQDFIVNYSGGEFCPGAPSTSGDQNRVEVTVFADNTDIVDVAARLATTSSRSWAATHDHVRRRAGQRRSQHPAPSVKFSSSTRAVAGERPRRDDFITANGVFGTATRCTCGSRRRGQRLARSGLIAGDVSSAKQATTASAPSRASGATSPTAVSGNDRRPSTLPATPPSTSRPSTARSACRRSRTRRSRAASPR